MTTIKATGAHANSLLISTERNRHNSGRLTRLADWYGAAVERSRGRRRLLELNDAELKDIGITRMDAQIEASKPFWR